MSVPPDPMIPRLARVVDRWREGPQTWTIEIEDADSAAAEGARAV